MMNMIVIATTGLVLEPLLASSILRTGAFILLGLLLVVGCITLYQWWQLRR